jgi:hypothetical protein
MFLKGSSFLFGAFVAKRVGLLHDVRFVLGFWRAKRGAMRAHSFFRFEEYNRKARTFE